MIIVVRLSDFLNYRRQERTNGWFQRGASGHGKRGGGQGGERGGDGGDED